MQPDPKTFEARANAVAANQKARVMEALHPLWLEACMIETAAARSGKPNEADGYKAFADSTTSLIANLIVNLAVNTANQSPRFETQAITYLELISAKCRDMCEAHKTGKTNIQSMVLHDLATGEKVPYDFRNHLKGLMQ